MRTVLISKGCLHHTLSLKGSGIIAKEGMKRLQEPEFENCCETVFHLGQSHFTNELTVAVVACTRARQSEFQHGWRKD